MTRNTPTQLQPLLLPSSEYHYPEGFDELMRRPPLSTVTEVRSAEFPSTNNAYVSIPGEKGTRLADSQAPYKSVDKNGGVYTMSGIRLEKHRRFLDFLFSNAKPFDLAGIATGYMFRRRAAAKAVEGDASKGAAIDKLVMELQRIQLTYTPQNCENEVDEAQPLCVGYKSKFTPGRPSKSWGLGASLFDVDSAIATKGFDPSTFEDYSFIAISMLYLGRFELDTTMRYHEALPTIFKMKPETAGLARFAVSNNFLPHTPLNEIIRRIGAATSDSGCDRVAKMLREPREAKLLAELGIEICLKLKKVTAPGTTNTKSRLTSCVIYDKSNSPTLSIFADGIFGKWNGAPSLSQPSAGDQGLLG